MSFEPDAEKVDPDPYVLVSIAVSTVAMVAQIASLFYSPKPSEPKKRPSVYDGLDEMRDGNLRSTVEKLRSHLEKSVVGLKRLERLLHKASSTAMEARFRFAEARIEFDKTTFKLVRGMPHELSSNAGWIGMYALDIAESEAESKHELIEKFAAQLPSLKQQIDGFHDGTLTNDEVLARSIAMLQAFQLLLEDFDGGGN